MRVELVLEMKIKIVNATLKKFQASFPMKRFRKEPEGPSKILICIPIDISIRALHRENSCAVVFIYQRLWYLSIHATAFLLLQILYVKSKNSPKKAKSFFRFAMAILDTQKKNLLRKLGDVTKISKHSHSLRWEQKTAIWEFQTKLLYDFFLSNYKSNLHFNTHTCPRMF